MYKDFNNSYREVVQDTLNPGSTDIMLYYNMVCKESCSNSFCRCLPNMYPNYKFFSEVYSACIAIY